MRCKKCGKNLKENERFCLVCGYYNDPEDNSDDYQEYNNDILEDDLLKEEKEDTTEPEIQIQAFQTDVSNNSEKKEKFYDFQYDRFLESYIGEDYKIVAEKRINIYALLLSWMYFLYRKLYIIGTLGLLITGLVIKLIPEYIIIYTIITMVLSGLLFNPIYKFVAKKRVLFIKKKNSYEDDFTIEKLCAKYGGVNFIVSLVMYLIFLVIMILSMYNVIFPSKQSKYFEENSENEATCTSLVKRIYNSRESLKVNGTIKEGVCNVVTGVKKDYNIYIKVTKEDKTYYQFYKTDNNYLSLKGSTEYLKELQEKLTNKTITTEEETFLNSSQNIENKYKTISRSSKTEDELIKNKKSTSEKLNYIIKEEDFKR